MKRYTFKGDHAGAVGRYSPKFRQRVYRFYRENGYAQTVRRFRIPEATLSYWLRNGF